jgi:hypothetical protein
MQCRNDEAYNITLRPIAFLNIVRDRADGSPQEEQLGEQHLRLIVC